MDMALQQWLVFKRLGALTALAALALGGALPTLDHTHAAGPTTSNTLTIGWNLETKNLAPTDTGVSNSDIWVDVNIYDQLIRVGPDGGTLLPDLATRWDMSKDGLTYTFHLRPNVIFQNGARLTASDVAFCLNRARQPSQIWSWTLAAIKSVTAPDPSTVVIRLAHPWAPLLSDVSMFDTGVYPQAYFLQHGSTDAARNSYLAQHPVGTGPYMLDAWVTGQYLRLKKNPSYWAAARYPMQYVEFDLIVNDNTRLLQVEARDLDVDNTLPFNQIDAARSSPGVQVQIDTSTEIRYFLFNTRAAPFGDVKVREAINHIIDRAAMAKAVTGGYGKPANSFIPAGALDYDPNLPVPSYDPVLARKLLSESSVPHGFTMTMETYAGDSISNEQAVIFQGEAAQIGIKVNIQPVDPTTLLSNGEMDCPPGTKGLCPKYHFGDSLWTSDIPDPDELVTFAVDFTQGCHAYCTWYDNPTLIKLSHEAEQISDPATRQKLYFQIQQIWSQENHIIALYDVPYVNAVSARLHGFGENPLGYFNLEGVTKS
jgi:peptide/nickel transport system substrate-binding protein